MGRLEIGRIVKPHGIRGEVVVAPITNRSERFEAGAEHYLADQRLTVTGARRHQGRWIVAYDGIPDRTAAEGCRGLVLTGEPIDVLAEGEMWVHELVGSRVVDDTGGERGEVVEVEVNPAHDLLVLDSGALVPIVFVTHFDADAGVVTIDPPDGLFALFDDADDEG